MKISRILFFLFAIAASAVFAQEADLAVEKFGPAEAPPDSDVAYSVTITNVGPLDSEFVTLEDLVPAGMSFVSATQNSGPTFTCDSSVSCGITTLPAGASANFTFVFHIDSGTEFTNIATVSSETPDPNDENDQSIAITTTGPPPQGDLFLQKSGPASAAPDTDVAFTITLGNAGPSAAENVLLTDNLPAGLTFVSFVQDSGPPMSCGTSTCTIASFPAGATATFTLTGHVPAGASGGTTYTNTATVESDNDPLDENNTASTTVTVSSADVSVVKTGPPAAVAGTTISYTITVTNNGPDAAQNVVLFEPSLCASQNCNLGTLAVGAPVVFMFDVDIPPDATSWSNTATVTTDSIDPNNSNNSSTVNTIITQSADVAIVKSGPGTVIAGTNATYSVTVTNNGPSDASNVSVTESLPAGTTFVSSTCGSTTCNLGTLAAGASVDLTFVVNVDVNATGPLVNTATVTSSTADPNANNNESSATTAVTPATADLAIVKSGPGTVVAGTDATYSITVTNNGPSSASNVSVTESLPPGTTFVSSTCGSTTCNLGTLAASASAMLTFVVHVDVNATGPLVNTATVTSSTADPNAANNESSATTAVTPATADLAIVKSGPGTVVAGTDATYSITVTNNGPVDASNVSVTESLPPGTTFVSSTCGSTTCNLGTLAASASAMLTFVVHVDVNATGPLVNTATVTSSTADPNAANNESSATTAVTSAPADLSITKTADFPQNLPGAQATFTIVVLNNGPGTATDVVVTDTLPAGTTLVSAPANCAGTTTITCTIGTLNAGASSTIDLVVTLPPTPGTVTNTATVDSSSTDPTPGNDEGTAAIVVAAATPAIPTLSPLALAVLALALASIVLVVLKKT